MKKSMKNKYLTLQKTAQTEIIIKKSRFITSVFPVNNEAEATTMIRQIKKEHQQATHNVFAYVINEQIQRFSDDGEPSGTAGKPVLEVIHHKGLCQIALVVTRYFGGIMLGAGGLVRAYSEAAVNGIEAAGVIEKLLYQELFIVMDYQWLGAVKREIENADGKQINISYEQQVNLQSYILQTALETVTNKIIDISAAQVIIKTGQYLYL